MSTGRVDHAALARAMSSYAAALVEGGYDVTEMLDQLAERAVVILSLASAGVVLRTSEGTLETVVSTDDRARRLEAHQSRIDDGPCYHAVRSGEVILVEDLVADDRWPDHAEVATAAGFRGVLGVPMPVGDAPVGALNLYDSEPRRWTDDELDVAVLLATMAAGYVVMARSLRDSRALTQQLQQALDSRVVIEQAKGMLAARDGVDVDHAFERLRAHARSTRRRVSDVAQDVVDRRLPADPDAWGDER